MTKTDDDNSLDWQGYGAMLEYLMKRRQALKLELVHIEKTLLDAGRIKSPTVASKRVVVQ
jgi:hypothetical protein